MNHHPHSTGTAQDAKANLSPSEQEELEGYLSEVVGTSTQFGVGHYDPEDNTDWLLR
ncbi:hypothetical protein [Uliginosibacterium sp. H1]|uniref:hypothetical protein n=1 Tax=Uliginosibacterium sp. H1 TaxID=3114757 RepID=UPI002E17369B|nr:hypothetical protein [Uliginosibacterium sp. H1]